MKEKLTIIIPCYNCEETLAEAVNSLYEQNIDSPFEVIMVDDSSNDMTKEVMQKLSEKYSEIKLFYHKENKGGGATRNTAVENSTGDIIFCLDSDDLLPPNTLPKMYKYLLEKNCDGVTFHKSIKFNGTNKNDINHIDVSTYVDKKIPLNALLSKKIKFQPLDVNFMYTRNAFNRIKGYPTVHGFDTQGFCWRFLCSGLNAYTCPDTAYLHRVNFKKSYYLRDYCDGKINYNWRNILIENYYIFNEVALDFIKNFDCENFSKNILEELKKLDNILISDIEDKLGKTHVKLDIVFPEPKYVKINSLKGIWFRIRNRIKNK